MTTCIIIYNKFPIFYPNVIVSLSVSLTAAELWRSSRHRL